MCHFLCSLFYWSRLHVHFAYFFLAFSWEIICHLFWLVTWPSLLMSLKVCIKSDSHNSYASAAIQFLSMCKEHFPVCLTSGILLFIKFYYYNFCSVILCDLLKNMPTNRLTKQKMMTINEIVHSRLFLYPECRQILLPVFSKEVKVLLETCEEVRATFLCCFHVNNAFEVGICE